MPARNWVVHHMAEDEDGQPERWEFHFRRPTGRVMLDFVRLQDPELPDADKIKLTFDVVGEVVRKFKRNGKAVKVLDVPFELHVEVLGLHPSFRESPTTD